MENTKFQESSEVALDKYPNRMDTNKGKHSSIDSSR